MEDLRADDVLQEDVLPRAPPPLHLLHCLLKTRVRPASDERTPARDRDARQGCLQVSDDINILMKDLNLMQILF